MTEKNASIGNYAQYVDRLAYRPRHLVPIVTMGDKGTSAPEVHKAVKHLLERHPQTITGITSGMQLSVSPDGKKATYLASPQVPELTFTELANKTMIGALTAWAEEVEMLGDLSLCDLHLWLVELDVTHKHVVDAWHFSELHPISWSLKHHGRNLQEPVPESEKLILRLGGRCHQGSGVMTSAQTLLDEINLTAILVVETPASA
jgi:hypothetical protein